MGTIKEVAKLAGVSYQAVSAVLNGNLSKASPATRERIFDAVKQLNYRPNRFARGLASGKSGIVGIVMQDIRSPYFADLTWELQNAADASGLQVIMMEADWSNAETLRCLKKLAAAHVDGIVLVSNVVKEAREQKIISEDFPLVLIDDDPTAPDSIGFDYLPGMDETFRHLLEMGHRRIIFAHDPIQAAKHRAYVACCRKYGIAMREFHYLSPTATGDTPVIACGHQLAEASPEIDAVIAAADYDALLLLYGLAERGCRVPETFSLVSIDDTLLGRFHIPPITSISLNRRELAIAVFRRLSDRIEKRPTDETHLSIPTHLVHRKSVVPNYDTVPQPQEQ